MDEKCKTAIGRWRCNFEGRYDDSAPTAEQIRALRELEMAGWDYKSSLMDLGGSTYVCDICTACGKQVLRPSGNSNADK